MQHQITVAGNNKAELVRGLQAHLAFLNGGDTAGTTTTQTAATATTRPRGGSKKQEADPTFGEDEQHEEETEELEAGSEEETESYDDTGAEEEAEAEEPSVTTDDVRKACGAYSQKLIKSGMSMADAKAKVREVLKKNFKVTLVDQLNENDLPKAIEVLKKAAAKAK